MINSCSQCGSLLYEYGRACPFCATPSIGSKTIHEDEPVAAGVACPEFVAGGSAEAAAGAYYDSDSAPIAMESASVAVARAPLLAKAAAAGAAVGRTSREPQPEWRQEVARRLESYRSRHPHPGRAAQPGLPFSLHADTIEEPEVEEEQEAPRPVARQALRAARPRPSERVEISVQPELDFNASRDDRSRPQTALVPVASVEDRRWAGMLDASFLLATFVGFLGLFRSLGGDILLHKVDAPVYLGAFFLLYAQYFALFTTFAGATPGMQLRGLYVVGLDGYLPDTRHLVWRSLGYMLSAGTLMLGFLWALWDEEHFTWQDRISQTYVTSGTPLGLNESALGQSQQTLGD